MRCNVCLNDAECEVDTGKKCFACGNAACGACSAIAATYYRFTRKRICNDCQEDHAGHFVLARKARPDAGGRRRGAAAAVGLGTWARRFATREELVALGYTDAGGHA